MAEDKKKMAALIVSRMAKPKMEEEMPEMEDEEEVGGDEETIAAEVLDAIQSGDAMAFSEALKAFIQLVG
jgi:hypothetical protein